MAHMTPQTPSAEVPKPAPEAAPKPAASVPQKPAPTAHERDTQAPSPVQVQTAQASEPVLAKPPEGVEFTEVTDEPQAPTTAGTVTQPVVMNATNPKKQKKTAKTGPKGPAHIITFAVLIFAALAGLAYYAYTKS